MCASFFPCQWFLGRDLACNPTTWSPAPGLEETHFLHSSSPILSCTGLLHLLHPAKSERGKSQRAPCFPFWLREPKQLRDRRSQCRKSPAQPQCGRKTKDSGLCYNLQHVAVLPPRGETQRLSSWLNRVDLQKGRERHIHRALHPAWPQTPAPTWMGTNTFQHLRKATERNWRYFSNVSL